jgi:hypothetical protein
MIAKQNSTPDTKRYSMSNLTGFKSADFRALQCRLVPRKAYSNKGEYLSATKKIRNAITKSKTVTNEGAAFMHELGHAVLAMHHNMEVEKVVVRRGAAIHESQVLPAVEGSTFLSRGIEEMCKAPTEEEVPSLLQMLCAGIIAAFNGMYCYIDGARSLRSTIFHNGCDADYIVRVLQLKESPYGARVKVHTMILQLLLGLKVTVRLSAESSSALHKAVCDAQRIVLANGDVISEMYMQDHSDPNDKGIYARLNKEELTTWAAKIQEKKRNA